MKTKMYSVDFGQSFTVYTINRFFYLRVGGVILQTSLHFSACQPLILQNLSMSTIVQIRIPDPGGKKSPDPDLHPNTVQMSFFSKNRYRVRDLSLAVYNPTNLLTSPQNARTQLNNLYSNVYCTLVGYYSGPMEARSVFGWQRKEKKFNLEVKILRMPI